MKIYGSQGKSGAVINSIKCGNNQNILKIINMSNYYMKMRTETNNYIFIELDGFTIQTLINNYVYKELPNNTINIINSGVCKNKDRSLKGYNLLEEATLGSGQDFFIKLLSGLYDDDFNIKNEDNRYVAITNYLLQVICIMGHLQSSKLEFFHGDYKPENVFVKKSDKKSLPVFTFKVFGKSIQVKNIGFVVLIADFDKSSITIEEEFNQKKYRIISPIVYKLFLRGSVNSIIKKYGDIDPDSSPKGVKFEKLFISHLVPKRMDPTMTVLRSAGIKLFRDFDLYTFFIKLLDSTRIREYFMTKRFNVTLMSFMSPKFINALYDMPAKETSISESAYITIDILNKIKEPMHSVFSDYYVETLSALNYRLFR
jgi:serine/threonine protein kinase